MFKTIDFNGRKSSVILTAVLLLICSNPYFFWWISSNILLSAVCKLFLCAMFFINADRDSRTNLSVALFVSSVFLLFFLQLIKGSQNGFGLLSTAINIFLVTLFGTSDHYAKSVYQVFVRILAVLWALALVSYLLEPIQPILGQIKHPQLERYYNVYAFHCKENLLGFVSFFRYNGIYMESGDVGTIAALILFIEKFNFKARRNYIFLISGIISMSLFFYVIMALYMLLYVATVKKKYVLAIVMVVGVVTFYYSTKDNEYIDHFIWSRLELNDDKTGFVGDNRMTEDADEYYENHVAGTSNFWFGLSDSKDFNRYAMGGSSYKMIVAQSGFIFVFIYLLSFIILCYKYNGFVASFWLFVLFLVLNMYQRVNLYYPDYCFLYIVFARYAGQNVFGDAANNNVIEFKS